MENLAGIGSALPPEMAEAQLAHAFRASALSLTALFKAGKKSTQKGRQPLHPTPAPFPTRCARPFCLQPGEKGG